MVRCQPKAGDRPLEQAGPKRAGDILAGGHQRDRGAPPTVEQQRDMRHQRRIERTVAEQADQQPIAQHELPGGAAGGERAAGREHHPAQQAGQPGRGPAGDPAHADAAQPGAEIGRRGGERGHAAGRAEILGDRHQRDDEELRRAEGDREDGGGGDGRGPGGAAIHGPAPHAAARLARCLHHATPRPGGIKPCRRRRAQGGAGMATAWPAE